MIPQEKIAAVASSLRETFGVTEFGDIQMLSGGGPRSDLVFRIVVKGSPYLLRIIRRTNDPACHFISMKTAAEAGLAPHVWFTNIEDRICITDFVKAVPFPQSEALVRMPAALRALHALPPFPGRANHLNTSCTFLLNKGPALDEFIRSFQAANLLPQNEKEELFTWYAEIAAVYPHDDSNMVSSHNDLVRPGNILFDGSRPWLVDWEAAFLNDRYADLAVVANFVAATDTEEKEYLHAYFGHAPDEYQLARFFLMQQIAHIFYTMGYLLLGSSGKPIDWTEDLPHFSDFHKGMWTGDINIADSQTKIIYGRVHWNRLSRNMRQARFDEAVRIISGQRRPHFTLATSSGVH
jgi:aminoglycoside phosphotransferase (APT) family kinase protein